MSDDYLSSLLTSLFGDGLDDLVQSICEPPPIVESGEEAEEALAALAVHVGRSNAHRAAFVLACSLLDNDGSMKLVARLTDLALAAQSPDVPLEPHINEAKRQLLDNCSQLREGYGLFPR